MASVEVENLLEEVEDVPCLELGSTLELVKKLEARGETVSQSAERPHEIGMPESCFHRSRHGPVDGVASFLLFDEWHDLLNIFENAGGRGRLSTASRLNSVLVSFRSEQRNVIS